MTLDEFRSMLAALAAGWTSRDYEKVAAPFSPNVFYSDPLNYTFRDRESLLAFFQDDDGCAQHCEFHDLLFDESAQKGVAEYTYEGTHRYHGTVWIDLEDGQISRWREYQHKDQRRWHEFWAIDEGNHS